jgi:hypothetical protein
LFNKLFFWNLNSVPIQMWTLWVTHKGVEGLGTLWWNDILVHDFLPNWMIFFYLSPTWHTTNEILYTFWHTTVLISNDFVGGWEKMMQKSRPFLLACSNRWIYLCITNFIATKNSIEKFDGTQNNDSYSLAKCCAPPDLVILLFHDPLQLQYWLRQCVSTIMNSWGLNFGYDLLS